MAMNVTFSNAELSYTTEGLKRDFQLVQLCPPFLTPEPAVGDFQLSKHLVRACSWF